MNNNTLIQIANRLLGEKLEDYLQISAYGGKRQTVPVYRNPTFEEIESIIKDDEYNSVRFFVTKDYTIFAWPSSLALHIPMIEALGYTTDDVLMQNGDGTERGRKNDSLPIKYPKLYNKDLQKRLKSLYMALRGSYVFVVDPDDRFIIDTIDVKGEGYPTVTYSTGEKETKHIDFDTPGWSLY